MCDIVGEIDLGRGASTGGDRGHREDTTLLPGHHPASWNGPAARLMRLDPAAGRPLELEPARQGHEPELLCHAPARKGRLLVKLVGGFLANMKQKPRNCVVALERNGNYGGLHEGGC